VRLQVLHETHYIYSSPVHAVAMEARLQPCNDEYQSRQRYRLTITPKTAIEEYTAFSDIQVQYWTLLKASELDVVSESVVDIHERPLLPIQVPPIQLDPIAFYAYLHETTLTGVTTNIEDFARQFTKLAAEDWYQTALAVREAIHSAIDFETGLTTTETIASDVLRLGRGVCQDFTHLMLATLRTLNIPARYTSGYLNQDTSPEYPHSQGIHQTQTMFDQGKGMLQTQTMFDQGMSQHQEQSGSGNKDREDSAVARLARPALRGTGASHAWVEVYFGGQEGWRGFDAANNLLVDQNFVRIGAGRDYHDVTPVKGVHKGPAEEDLKVTVSVTRVP
jgi:transglutaminase-like putative cysteine protease